MAKPARRAVALVVTVQLAQPLQEITQQPALGQSHLAQIVGLASIEGNPQEDKAASLV